MCADWLEVVGKEECGCRSAWSVNAWAHEGSTNMHVLQYSLADANAILGRSQQSRRQLCVCKHLDRCARVHGIPVLIPCSDLYVFIYIYVYIYTHFYLFLHLCMSTYIYTHTTCLYVYDTTIHVYKYAIWCGHPCEQLPHTVCDPIRSACGPICT